jgi:putative CocE/NonD family hydrolase
MFLGRRNALFQAWLAHPSYDRYWRKMIPSDRQFADLDIPVLTIAGYYDADVGALHYFEQHLRADPKADHRLLVGPWDAGSIGSGLATSLRGYSVAKAAQVDLPELRYQWFDHVLKQAALPAQLQDRVNLQLMGSNDWRHAATLEALAGKPRKFWLDIASPPDRARLLETPSPSAAYLEQSVDLADRSDAYAPLDEAIVSRTLPLKNAIAFSSEPLSQPTEFDGRLGGQLDFAPNRQDVDLRISLYELQRNGDYVQLFAPYAFRASYAPGPGERRLLRAGERQQLRFRSERITSRRLQAGSRLVLVLGVNKRPDQQINYGSGKAVAQETLADARPPLRIRWYAGTGIELPQHQ